MEKGITPVLDIIGPDSTEARAEAPKIGMVEKSQKAWGWLQQWTKDVKEYVGAHVLSLVRAHYLCWKLLAWKPVTLGRSGRSKLMSYGQRR
jgi:hypothetical protein